MSRDPFPEEREPRRAEAESDTIRGHVGGRKEIHQESLPDPPKGANDMQRDPSEEVRAKSQDPDVSRVYHLRDRTYFLRDSELKTLVEIGTFRVINADDLSQFTYAGDSDRMRGDLRRLAHQGFVGEKLLKGERGGTKRLLVLTKKGKHVVLKSGRLPEGQAIYHGLAKPREAKHDAALYRLYQREAARIALAGGRPGRVVLDYELKRNLHRELAQLGDAGQTDEARAGIAERHGLTLVNNKIQIPDLRLKYETAELEPKHVDLELATRNYRPRALAQKTQAGFSLYASREDASKLRRVLDEAELSARIFSL
jgi:hypothetical protein